MVERVFDCRMDSLLDISEWIHGECRSMRNVYRVTVRVEPMPGCTEKAKDTVIVREYAVKKHEGYNQYAVVGSKDSYWSPVIAAAEEFGRVSSAGKVRIEFTPEPLPERVKWPDAWSDVNRLELVPNKREPQYNVFVQFGDGNSTRAYFGSTYGAPFGIRDDDRHVTRIAENDSGFVRLSEVPNAE